MEGTEEKRAGEKIYQLRSRSRSRSTTPLVLGRAETENEGSEHHYDLRSKSRERSMTPGEVVSSSGRSTSISLPSSVVKARNKNMETISEQRDDTLTETTPEIQSKRTAKLETTIVKSTKKAERRSERQRSKRQIFANGQNESKDDSSDTRSETKERKSLTPKRTMTSDYSSEEGDREDAPSRSSSAYEFYKQQGEYWNKFPKTDYTYSPASTCRYEVAPGVMAIPNMSRRSLHSENSYFSSQTSNSQSSKDSLSDENTSMELNDIRGGSLGTVSQVIPHIRNNETAGQSIIYKRTIVETHQTRREFLCNTKNNNEFSERYELWADKLNSNNNRYRAANVDSDTDFDDAVSVSNNKLKSTRQLKLTSLISTWFYTALHFITFGQFKKQKFSTSHYYRGYKETKWSRLRRQIDTFMQHMYLLLVKIILLDTWLLSRASKIRERVQGRHTKILWLLLPLVLMIGYFYLPQILSAIPLIYNKQLLPEIKPEIPTVQSSLQEELKLNAELRNLVEVLIHQHLETTKAKESVHLGNITQSIEDLKRTYSDIQKQYDKKLSSLEQELELEKSNNERCRAEELDIIRVEFQTLKQLYSQLKTCCDAASSTVNKEEIQQQVDNIILKVINSKAQQEELRSVTEAQKNSELGERSSLSMDEVRKNILEILKIYDADKTGQVDWALESAGGEIVSTRCTQHYNMHSRAFKIFGLTLYYESNNPRTVIQGNILRPGACWAFQDFPGYLVIRLRSPIRVTGFSVEHASRANLPNGEMKSAPKKFEVWGLREENDFDAVLFGQYEFSDTGESLQYFPVQDTSITSLYEYVQLKIQSNHGQLEYTCLYRFRVHGNLA